MSLSHTLFLCHSLSRSLFVIISFSLFLIHIICLSLFFLLSALCCHTFYAFVTISFLLSLFIVFSFCHNHFLSISHTHYLFVTIFFLLRALFVTPSMSLPQPLFLCHTFSCLCHTLSSIVFSFVIISFSLFPIHIICLSHFYFFFVLSLCHLFMSLSQPLFLCNFLLHTLLSHPLSHTFSPFPIHITCLSHISFLFMLALCFTFSFLCHTLSSFVTLYCVLFLSWSLSLSFTHTLLVCHAFLSSLCYLFVTTSLSLSHYCVLFLSHSLSHTFSLFPILIISLWLFFLLSNLFATLSMSLPHSFPYALSLSHGLFLSHILLSSHTLFLSHILSLSQFLLSFFLMISLFICDSIVFSFFLMLSPLFVKRSINFFSLCIPLSFKLAHIVFFFSFTFSPFPSTRLSCTSNIDCSNWL